MVVVGGPPRPALEEQVTDGAGPHVGVAVGREGAAAPDLDHLRVAERRDGMAFMHWLGRFRWHTGSDIGQPEQ